jgi:hypothetical protein
MTRWPPEYRAWAQSHHLLARSERRAPVALKATITAAQLNVVNPPSGAVYLLDPTLRREFQTLPLRASTSAGGPIEWRVDGERVGRCDADAKIDWPLVRGAHTISAIDGAGHQADALILVK